MGRSGNGDIIILTDKFKTFYYRELPYYKTINLIRLSEENGWKYAVALLENKFVRDYITSPLRLSFTPFVRIPSVGRILDLGAGWGSISMILAKMWPKVDVYAYDLTIEGLRFLNVVKKQENLSNLKIFCGDILDLPFNDNFFDLVVVMGVLEWLPESAPEMSPYETQMGVLKKIFRILKDGGELILGIENRFGYQFLLGARDHSGERFTSLMPRSIANLYMKIKKKRPYLWYTYSERGYRALLKGAGFTDVKVYAAFKDYRLPILVFSPKLFKKAIGFLPKRTLKMKLFHIIPSFITRFIVPSFIIVCRKDGHGDL